MFTFIYSDHLYLIEVQMKDQSAPKPLLSSLFYAFRLAIEKTLERIQQFYSRDDEHQHQVYVTLWEDRIKGGLNTGTKINCYK